MYSELEDEKWADFIHEQYLEYMAENCTCASSDCECPCVVFSKFEEEYLQTLEERYLAATEDMRVSEHLA